MDNNRSIKLLFLADVVGKVGRQIVTRLVPQLKTRYSPNLTVINGENSAGGIGIDPGCAGEIFGAGADVITTGNHIWNRREVWGYLDEHRSKIIRPANFPSDAPGIGYVIKEINGVKVAVVNLIARVFMPDHVDCPFRTATALLEGPLNGVKIIFVDFHGEATSEKAAFAYFVDGKVSAVVGTHTHVQTADERILPQGTAFLTDGGMCGPAESIIGMKTDLVIKRFASGLPVRFDVASGPAILNGAFIEIDAESGRALRIERVSERD